MTAQNFVAGGFFSSSWEINVRKMRSKKAKSTLSFIQEKKVKREMQSS